MGSMSRIMVLGALNNNTCIWRDHKKNCTRKSVENSFISMAVLYRNPNTSSLCYTQKKV